MTGSIHPLRRFPLVVAGSVSVLLVGLLAVIGHGAAPVVYAATCQAPWNCGIDTTVTSAVVVQHVYDPQSTNQAVEPATGESLSIVSTWNTNVGPNCGTMSETSTVDVDGTPLPTSGCYRTSICPRASRISPSARSGRTTAVPYQIATRMVTS